MPADLSGPQSRDTSVLWTRFPDLPPDVLVRTRGQMDALAAELAKAHDLTLSEARDALSEVAWTH